MITIIPARIDDEELNQADALFGRERSRQAMVKVRAQHVPEVDALVMLIVWSVAAEKFVFCRLDDVDLVVAVVGADRERAGVARSTRGRP